MLDTSSSLPDSAVDYQALRPVSPLELSVMLVSELTPRKIFTSVWSSSWFSERLSDFTVSSSRSSSPLPSEERVFSDVQHQMRSARQLDRLLTVRAAQLRRHQRQTRSIELGSSYVLFMSLVESKLFLKYLYYVIFSSFISAYLNKVHIE